MQHHSHYTQIYKFDTLNPAFSAKQQDFYQQLLITKKCLKHVKKHLKMDFD